MAKLVPKKDKGIEEMGIVNGIVSRTGKDDCHLF
jgi:hypothetical protein